MLNVQPAACAHPRRIEGATKMSIVFLSCIANWLNTLQMPVTVTSACYGHFFRVVSRARGHRDRSQCREVGCSWGG